MTKLSLVAALAVSAAFAGGDIVPIEPVASAPVAEATACNNNTTVNGKLVGYLYSDDSAGSLFDDESTQFATAATLDVSHKIVDGITANFSAVGYLNTMKRPSPYMEGDKVGAFFNVANLTATYGDTTFIAGRQLLDTPMLGGFDWLLAPGAFEAYTVANSSIENVTLVGSYVAKWRQNNTGDTFLNLADAGDNFTVGAAYSDSFDASVWYYNIDNTLADYTQVYADAGVEFSSVNLAAQFANTSYGAAAEDDSTAYGVKASTSVAGFDLMAAYNNIADNTTGYIGRDTLYASSWNTFTSNSVGNAFKVEAGTEFSGLSATASYAYYEYDQVNDEGSEIDVILGYEITDCISVDAIYSNTDYGLGDDINALELIATYKF